MKDEIRGEYQTKMPVGHFLTSLSSHLSTMTYSLSLLLTDLSVVGGDDGDAVGGVAQQPHVLEHRHHVLRLAKVLRVGEGAR